MHTLSLGCHHLIPKLVVGLRHHHLPIAWRQMDFTLSRGSMVAAVPSHGRPKAAMEAARSGVSKVSRSTHLHHVIVTGRAIIGWSHPPLRVGH